MRAGLWLICAVALAWPAWAQNAAQDIGLRPQPRPQILPPADQADAAAIPKPSLKPLPRPAITAAVSPPNLSVQTNLPAPAIRPMPRPREAAPTLPPQIALQTPPAASATSSALSSATSSAMTRSPRPQPRPKALLEAVAAVASAPSPPEAPEDTDSTAAKRPNLIQLLFGAGGAAKVPQDQANRDLASAAPAPNVGTQSAPRKGSVCGDRSIRGEAIKAITSTVKGCGIAEPVRVTEVSGVRLSQAVTVECGTVQALKQWIDTEMRPAFGRREVVQLRIAAHYACRGRNNKRGARISEHGKGRALDISGFIFTDGTEWTISRDYNKQIRAAHKGACGIFGTTLGPGSDGFHEDHLHFDIAQYRSGTYCR